MPKIDRRVLWIVGVVVLLQILYIAIPMLYCILRGQICPVP